MTLQAAGIQVSAEGGKLSVRPSSKLNDELRSAVVNAKSELLQLLSQQSQVGSSAPATAAQPAWRTPWSADDIAAFLARRDRLLRWGWTEAEAEAVAGRLTGRDQDGMDDRRACVDCRRFAFSVSGHCTRHRAALLASPVIGRDLATQPQRCPAHAPVARLDPSMAG
jgi:hypothetical protein